MAPTSPRGNRIDQLRLALTRLRSEDGDGCAGDADPAEGSGAGDTERPGVQAQLRLLTTRWKQRPSTSERERGLQHVSELRARLGDRLRGDSGPRDKRPVLDPDRRVERVVTGYAPNMSDSQPPSTPPSAGAPVPEGDSDEFPSSDAPRFTDQPIVETGQGLRVPRIGLGTWQLDGPVAGRLVEEALDLGVRHIDTAQMYGNEADVGAGLARSHIDRSEIFLTTKIDNGNHEPDDVVASTEKSLELLGTDHVDLLLVHWPVEWDRMGATLAAVANVHAAGMARHIGVSNFTVEQLEQAADHAPLEVLQVECHPFLQQSDLRQWCEDHDWVFTAYSPIAQGAVLDNEVISTIARDHDCSETAVTLAWLSGKPNVVSIPRTTDVGHLRSNWKATTLELTADECAAIDALDRGERLIDPDFAPW